MAACSSRRSYALMTGNHQTQPSPETEERCAGLLWKGPLDSSALEEARRRVESVVSPGCEALIIDLAQTEYIDSQGVRFLEELQRDLRQRRTRLTLSVTRGSRVDRTLRLLHADEVLEITRLEETASPAEG